MTSLPGYEQQTSIPFPGAGFSGNRSTGHPSLAHSRALSDLPGDSKAGLRASGPGTSEHVFPYRRLTFPSFFPPPTSSRLRQRPKENWSRATPYATREERKPQSERRTLCARQVRPAPRQRTNPVSKTKGAPAGRTSTRKQDPLAHPQPDPGGWSTAHVTSVSPPASALSTHKKDKGTNPNLANLPLIIDGVDDHSPGLPCAHIPPRREGPTTQDLTGHTPVALSSARSPSCRVRSFLRIHAQFVQAASNRFFFFTSRTPEFGACRNSNAGPAYPRAAAQASLCCAMIPHFPGGQSRI